MKLRFTQRATQDLIDIADYIGREIPRLPSASVPPFSIRCRI
jgi:plasmid stabilization system protein ParE